MLALMATGCGDVVQPKPRGYFRITLPEHAYQTFAEEGEPYTFEHSTLSKVLPDDERGAQPHWVNIYYPSLGCKIHVTYLHLAKGDDDNVYEDSYKLAYKHTIMADAIGERYYDDAQNRVYGTFYDIKGNAANPAQFAITDSANQFFRGSLYFYCRPNKDSLAPVVKYVNEDILHLMETFRWNSK